MLETFPLSPKTNTARQRIFSPEHMMHIKLKDTCCYCPAACSSMMPHIHWVAFSLLPAYLITQNRVSEMLLLGFFLMLRAPPLFDTMMPIYSKDYMAIAHCFVLYLSVFKELVRMALLLALVCACTRYSALC